MRSGMRSSSGAAGKGCMPPPRRSVDDVTPSYDQDVLEPNRIRA